MDSIFPYSRDLQEDTLGDLNWNKELDNILRVSISIGLTSMEFANPSFNYGVINNVVLNPAEYGVEEFWVTRSRETNGRVLNWSLPSGQ